jgi:threonine synthase
METTEGFTGLRCLDCEQVFDPDATPGRCPDCRGILDPEYDEGTLQEFHERLLAGNTGVSSGSGDHGLARFAPALPFGEDQLVTLTEGTTPLVECPTLAAAWNVDRVLVKDEGRNGTGGIVDREMALAVTAAREHGASDVALPSTGNGGQAAAAYAARAGLDSHSFVPSRTIFDNKAMINVHGGDMNVVGGRYPDACDAFESERAPDWDSLAPFETPYRHEGCKTLAYELAVSTEDVPDAVVHPTGHGTGLVGLAKGFRELARTGAVETQPELYAAQATGCAPLADGWDAGERDPEPVDHPDALCGPLEVPDPAGGSLVLDALAETDGGAIATPDDEILDGAVDLAQAGVPTSATGGAAVSGGHALAEQGAFEADDTVVLVNPTTANRESDLLRSHLMKQGI